MLAPGALHQGSEVQDQEAVLLGAPVVGPGSAPEANVFDAVYAGTERFLGRHDTGVVPWEIGTCQPAVEGLLSAGLIRGRVLDAGCGTGATALRLAAAGHDVVGVDASRVAIERALDKVAARAVGPRFFLADVLELGGWGERFDTVVMAGLLHIFSARDRVRLTGGLHGLLRPGGRCHVLCFDDGRTSPCPMTRADVTGSFGPGWSVERIVPSRYELLGDAGGCNAWLMSAVRI